MRSALPPILRGRAAYWVSVLVGASVLIALLLPMMTTAAIVNYRQTNSRNGKAIFVATNVKPGTTRTSTVTIANTGLKPIRFRLTQDRVTTKFSSALRFRIYDATTKRCIYPSRTVVGPCTRWGVWRAGTRLSNYPIKGKPRIGSTLPSATFARGEKHYIRVSWNLLRSSPNADKRKRGTFRLVWKALQ